MADSDNEEFSVSFKINKNDLSITDMEKKSRELSDVEWENLKKILDSNNQSYIDRCMWILTQIQES